MTWSVANAMEELTLAEQAGPVRSVAFSPDSQRIVTGGTDRIAKMWVAIHGRELLTLSRHDI